MECVATVELVLSDGSFGALVERRESLERRDGVSVATVEVVLLDRSFGGTDE